MFRSSCVFGGIHQRGLPMPPAIPVCDPVRSSCHYPRRQREGTATMVMDRIPFHPRPRCPLLRAVSCQSHRAHGRTPVTGWSAACATARSRWRVVSSQGSPSPGPRSDSRPLASWTPTSIRPSSWPHGPQMKVSSSARDSAPVSVGNPRNGPPQRGHRSSIIVLFIDSSYSIWANRRSVRLREPRRRSGRWRPHPAGRPELTGVRNGVLHAEGACSMNFRRVDHHRKKVLRRRSIVTLLVRGRCVLGTNG